MEFARGSLPTEWRRCFPEPFSLGFILACPEDIPADIPIKFPEDFLKDCPLRPWAVQQQLGTNGQRFTAVRSLPEM